MNAEPPDMEITVPVTRVARLVRVGVITRVHRTLEQVEVAWDVWPLRTEIRRTVAVTTWSEEYPSWYRGPIVVLSVSQSSVMMEHIPPSVAVGDRLWLEMP